MELVEGRDLQHLVVPGGLAVSRVLELGIPLADALAAAHEKGVVHRDLKPSKIMVTPGGRAPLKLTSAHVRQLSVRNARLIGHPVFYFDNRVPSETLVVFLHAMGGDHRWFERALRAIPCRAVSVSLVGFAAGDTYRPVLSIDDHSRILRILLQDLVRESPPRTTVLVGHSAGADHFLRMIASEQGLGIDVSALVALGPNVNLETLFVSKLYVNLDSGDSEAMLEILKDQ